MALPYFTGLFRQQLHCWQDARFVKQIELPLYLGIYHGNSLRAYLMLCRDRWQFDYMP